MLNMKVMGIDPGSLRLGWGILTIDESQSLRAVDFGVLKVSSRETFYTRLHLLSLQLSQLIEEFKPDVAVIEQIFLGKSVDSAFKLGHVRGMCAVQCQGAGLVLAEYAARTVKKQVTGAGNSDKQTVQNFLCQHLGVRLDENNHDASDALALAYCHMMRWGVERKMKHMEAR